MRHLHTGFADQVAFHQHFAGRDQLTSGNVEQMRGVEDDWLPLGGWLSMDAWRHSGKNRGGEDELWQEHG